MTEETSSDRWDIVSTPSGVVVVAVPPTGAVHGIAVDPEDSALVLECGRRVRLEGTGRHADLLAQARAVVVAEMGDEGMKETVVERLVAIGGAS